MNKAEIELIIKSALDELHCRDSLILEMDVNERSISHKLAIYLEKFFDGWSVDCEYNRNHDHPKRLEFHASNILSDDVFARTVFPDIIVHKRHTDENLLVIEMKKSTSPVSKDFDLEKLNAFKIQLNYQFAVFIKIGIGAPVERYPIEWVD